MKLINLYKKWMRQRHIHDLFIANGLCGLIPQKYKECWHLFDPTTEDLKWLINEGFCSTYYASGLPKSDSEERRGFTPLRQTIVCFLMAMHNEI